MSNSKGISIRRVSITRQEDMPTFGIAQSVGGTMYGTTPGGTRIIYDRLFLLKQKESPAARTPPSLPQIPGVTRDLEEADASPSTKPRKCSVINEGEEEQTSNDSNKQPTCSTSTAGNNEQIAEEDDLLEEDEDDVGMEM
jgi:hypothetical protein